MDYDAELIFRNFTFAKTFKFDDEKVSTDTSRDQKEVENSVEKCFDRFQQLQFLDPKIPRFYREEHERFLDNMIHHLPTYYECLDSSRPWNIYWILQSAFMLNHSFSDETLEHVVQFLAKCGDMNGGFGGGPGQYPHLGTTYAAVNSLASIGTLNAYNAINRDSLIRFLFSLRQPNGAFRLHIDGETDLRGAYCAISCAKLVNVPKDVANKLFDKTGDWIVSCQTYEGGFGGSPGLEAHGGYTFCGIAALALLNEVHKCDIDRLLRWNLQRQMPYEGGFQGRTNKLVDGCYSFWVGASVLITQAVIDKDKKISKSVYDIGALQEYILLCCQKRNGGLIDKPGKAQDLYHTCYTLTGVSIAQHSELGLCPQVVGDPINELLPTHPLYNVPPFAVASTARYFQTLNDLREKVNMDENSENTDKESYTSNSLDIDETTDDDVQAELITMST